MPACPISRRWWDMNPEASHYLSRCRKPEFVVRLVRWCNTSKTSYEILHIHDTNPPYKLIIYRATDILHCLRLPNATRLDDLVEELCQYGTRFNVYVDEKNLVGPQHARFQDAIPYRPLGFKPEISDYAYYVRKRGTLLEDPAIARAALMHGGLIWRIAMEHVSSSDVILSGPGQDMGRYGMRHTLEPQGGSRDRCHLWTESLSEDQIDIICGVYRIYRSTSASNSFTQDLSWFPRQRSFTSSGLDLGHWNADAEDWYQRRVQLYVMGDPKGRCLNQSQWKGNIRLWRTTIRTFKGIEAVSQGFLNRQLL
ncbi:uncharacterized protein EV420DRAFT_1521732, partial [Desarmillaria tabescens]